MECRPVRGGAKIHVLPDEESIAIQGTGHDGPFCCVVIDLESSVLAIASERDPVQERIANRLGELAFLRQHGRCLMQPLAQGLELGSCTCLTHCVALMRRATADLLFDFVQSPDPLKGLKGDRRGKRYMDVV